MAFNRLKNLKRLGTRDSVGLNDSESAPSTPGSPDPSVGSPLSTAPTTPNLDSPSEQSGKRSGLLGRTSSLMKSAIPSPNILDASKVPSQSPEAEDEDGSSKSGGMLGSMSKLTSMAGNISISTPNFTLPTPSISLPIPALPLSKIDIPRMLETFTGSSSEDGDGASSEGSSGGAKGWGLQDIWSSVKQARGLPGIRRVHRIAAKADDITDDLFKQGNERRKQLWKLIIVAANGFTLPDILSSSSKGKSFVLKPPAGKRSTIPLQWIHRGHGAIDDDLANKLCTELGAEKLLQHLNEVLGTKYTFADRPGLSEVLNIFTAEDKELEALANGDEKLLSLITVVTGSRNFGRAYGMLRPTWADGNFEGLLELWARRKAMDEEMRASAIEDDIVMTPRIPPRRVWDLHSNRVLPFWAIIDSEDQLKAESQPGARSIFKPRNKHASQNKNDQEGPGEPSSNIPEKLWAVSHAWVHGEYLECNRFIINDRAWPVPLPKDSCLENVRIELLNLGSKYAWLDVLCLMQEDKGNEEHEAERAAQWRLDVPTIGHVYQHNRYQTVITFFQGIRVI